MGRLRGLIGAFRDLRSTIGDVATSTGTCAAIPVGDVTIDYIFTIPLLVRISTMPTSITLLKSWHRVLTDSQPEAIVDRDEKQKYSRLSSFDASLLRRVCTHSEARPLDDGCLQQFVERCMAGDTGSARHRWLRRRGCENAGQTAGLLSASDEQRGQAGPRHLRLQADRGFGRALCARDVVARKRLGLRDRASWPRSDFLQRWRRRRCDRRTHGAGTSRSHDRVSCAARTVGATFDSGVSGWPYPTLSRA